MIGVSALPSVPTVLPTSGNKIQATTNGSDFRSHLEAQSRSHVQQLETTSAQVLSDSTTNLSRRPGMEAMLQMLAWRKRTDSAPSRPGPSVPDAQASGVDIASFNFPVRGVLATGEVIQQSCLNEEGGKLYLKSFNDLAVCASAGEESELPPEVNCGWGLNAFAIAVALSVIILTWIPTEIVRAPLRSPKIRNLRRRKPSSVESDLYDRSDLEERG